jgi:hypothetical protein
MIGLINYQQINVKNPKMLSRILYQRLWSLSKIQELGCVHFERIGNLNFGHKKKGMIDDHPLPFEK